MQPRLSSDDHADALSSECYPSRRVLGLASHGCSSPRLKPQPVARTANVRCLCKVRRGRAGDEISQMGAQLCSTLGTIRAYVLVVSGLLAVVCLSGQAAAAVSRERIENTYAGGTGE